MWEVVSSSSSMADVGACHTVDAKRHTGDFTMFAWYGKCRRPQHCLCLIGTWGGALPYLSGMGVDGAHNTVVKMSTPTTLLVFCHVREVAGYCPAGVQGTVLGITIDLSASPYLLRLIPGSVLW